MSTDVSVIIAAYNPGLFLRTTLAAVVGQSYSSWECIVVDDGSEEDVGWVSTIDPRIRLVGQQNQGVSAARNRGASLAAGAFLCFLDQDDVWRPTYLSAQREKFVDSKVAISSTGFDIIDSAGARISGGYIGHNSSYNDLLQGCGLQCSMVMVRAEDFWEVGGFRDFAISQDWDLWLRILRRSDSIVRNDSELGSWRRHQQNASADYAGLVRDCKQILREHPHPNSKTGMRRIREIAFSQAIDAARATDKRLSLQVAMHLARALRYSPRRALQSAGMSIIRKPDLSQ